LKLVRKRGHLILHFRGLQAVGEGSVGSGGLQIDHKLELLGELNRKISRSLGLIVSNQMQLLADEVVE
jgi:hypothetical protein